MAKANSLVNYALMFGFVFLMGLAGLILLAPAMSAGSSTITIAHQSSEAVHVPDWLAGQQATVPKGLTINGHATKHKEQALDAWKLYALLLEGKCVASTMLCGGSEIERLYICVDPVTGLVGGMLQFGDEIMTGYGSDALYWERRIARERWGACDD